jgi:DNA-binding MarR family transcriptional regulator
MRSVTSTTDDDTATVSDDELPLLMLRTLKAMVERLHEDEEAAASKFTPVHGLVTRYLDRNDDVTIIELADHLHVTKQSASELVGALEAGGYVRRRPNPADRRSRFLELTAKGRNGLARSRDRWHRIEAEWATAASDDALATVRAAMASYLASRESGAAR